MFERFWEKKDKKKNFVCFFEITLVYSCTDFFFTQIDQKNYRKYTTGECSSATTREG